MQLGGSAALITGAQCPAGLHCRQVPSQAPSQQTPSTQKPDAQLAAASHIWPSANPLFTHSPAASQVWAPVQPAVSALAVTWQWPPVSQLLHGPLQAASQHRPLASVGFGLAQ